MNKAIPIVMNERKSSGELKYVEARMGDHTRFERCVCLNMIIGFRSVNDEEEQSPKRWVEGGGGGGGGDRG